MVESPASLTSAELIKARIDEKRLFEARFLFKKFSSEIDPSAHRQLRQQLENLIEQAGQIFTRAKQLEKQGCYEEARQGYTGVVEIAIDFPGIDQALQRVTVALALGPLESVSSAGEQEKIREQAASFSADLPVEPEMKPAFFRRWKRLLFFATLAVAVLVLLAVFGIFRVKNELPAQSKNSVAKVSTTAVRPLKKSVALPMIPKVVPGKDGNLKLTSEKIVVSRAIEPPIVQDEIQPVREKEVAGKSGQRDNAVGKIRTDVLRKTEQVEKSIKAETAVDVPSDVVVRVVIPAQRQAPQMVHVGSSSMSVVVYDTQEFHSEDGAEKENTDIPSIDNVLAGSSAREQRSYAVPSGDEFASGDTGPQLNSDGTYTVQSGDSLGGIALKIYGNSMKWSQLYELNRDRISSPSSLRVGLKLRIREEEGGNVDNDPVGE